MERVEFASGNSTWIGVAVIGCALLLVSFFAICIAFYEGYDNNRFSWTRAGLGLAIVLIVCWSSAFYLLRSCLRLKKQRLGFWADTSGITWTVTDLFGLVEVNHFPWRTIKSAELWAPPWPWNHVDGMVIRIDVEKGYWPLEERPPILEQTFTVLKSQNLPGESPAVPIVIYPIDWDYDAEEVLQILKDRIIEFMRD